MADRKADRGVGRSDKRLTLQVAFWLDCNSGTLWPWTRQRVPAAKVEVEVEVEEAPVCTERNWALSPDFAKGLAC